jgi:hypothetical protein
VVKNFEYDAVYLAANSLESRGLMVAPGTSKHRRQK